MSRQITYDRYGRIVNVNDIVLFVENRIWRCGRMTSIEYNHGVTYMARVVTSRLSAKTTSVYPSHIVKYPDTPEAIMTLLEHEIDGINSWSYEIKP